MNVEMSWDGIWTLSFGLSQFHGHGFWIVCEVALGQNIPCVRTHMNMNSLKHRLVEGPVMYGFTLHLRVRDHTT
jgi:hypothetical protein